MLLGEILLLAGLALLLRLAPASVRRWLIFAASALVVYWLQPGMPIRGLDYWLPTATLAIAALGWLLTAQPGERPNREDAVAGAVLAGLALIAGLTRYLGAGDWLQPTRPPNTVQVIVGLAIAALAFAVLAFALRGKSRPTWLIGGAILLLIALLVVLKTPALALVTAQGLRGLAGQNPALATAFDLRWLGFSYLAFRLIHTLRDRQTGRLPAVGLRDYLSYAVFFPALVAGPIDRLDRFTKDLCVPEAEKQARLGDDLTQAGRRLALGLFKKFAVADTLALAALAPENALQVQGSGWLWLLLYLYALRIYFDFSGYTDIAIGLGQILGIKLPENFAAPYLKPNLTQFWNSWHMSLTQWFRGYFFNPFVRWLRGERKLSPVWVLLLSQVCTMLLIGLWHGVTVNFVLWGLWHGLGLFAQNRWTDLTRGWWAAREISPAGQRGWQIASTVFTFHYVALGWVFFVLPTPQMAGMVLARLFGAGW